MSETKQDNNLNDSNQGLSYDTKTLIVVITLIFVYPVGFVLMYLWMKWNNLIKFIISLPVYVLLLALIIGFLSVFNPNGSIEKAQCAKSCEVSQNRNTCTQTCLNNLHRITPTPTYEP